MIARAAWILVALGACGDGSQLARSPDDARPDTHVTREPDVSDTSPPVPPDGLPCGEVAHIVAVEPWPGHGVGVVVRLAADVSDQDVSANASLAGVPAVVGWPAEAPGVTGFALTDPTQRDLALEAFDALPPGETVVVWAGETLAAEATTDQAHARLRLATTPIVGTPSEPALWRRIQALGGPSGTVARAIVKDGEAPARPRLARVGACPSPDAGPIVTLTLAGANCEVVLPTPEPHLAAVTCDSAAIAADQWPFGTRVDIILDSAETELWEKRKHDASKDDFSGHVRLGSGEPLAATLHFRGQTSMDCERKSYDVNLAGPDARRLAPGAAGDEFLLVSMCKDDGHYNQLLGDRMAAQLGLFGLGFRAVHLFVNELDQGIYLLLEDPREGLEADTTATAAMIRRRLDQDGNAPDVERTAVDEPWAMEAYDKMVAAAGDGARALSARLDLDAYLRWMALAVMLQNGDYVDEVFFYGALEAGQDHPYFRVMGWDPDDLWAPCHRNGVAAIPDPHGILYCVEANIDHLLFADPDIYDRFVTHLETLLAAWPIERVAAEMDHVRDMLFPLMVDDATARAMVELHAAYPDSVTAEGWKATVDGKMARDLERHVEWRDALSAAVAAYRAERRKPRLHHAVAVPGHLVAVRVDVDDPELASVTVDGHEVPLHRGRGLLTAEAEDVPSVARRALGAADFEISSELVVRAGETWMIPAGTRVLLGADARIVVYGTLVVAGTLEAPVLFTPANPTEPWAAIEAHDGGRVELWHTWLVGGGADDDRFGGHSGSDAFVAAFDSELVIGGGGIVDGPGKALYTESADVVLDGITIARTDTGGEHVASHATLRNAWVFEIPDADGSADDDNDAIYLRLGEHEIEDVVFAFGEDDAIDHNEAALTVRRVWIEGFAHEGVAASNEGPVLIEDVVVKSCAQGIEAGYGAPDVTVRRAYVTDTGVGLRWGDDYEWEALGRMTVEDSIVTGNDRNVFFEDPQQGSPPADAVAIACSALGSSEWDEVAGNVPGTPPEDRGCPAVVFACGTLIGPTDACRITAPH